MATFIRPVTDNQICVYNLTVRESARSLNRSLNTTSPLGRLQVRGSLLFQLDVDVSAFAIVLVLNASITPMCAFTSCEVHRELWCVLTVGALSICMPLADRLEGCVNLRELTAGEVSINREKYIASSLTASSTSFYVSNPPVRLRSTVRRSTLRVLYCFVFPEVCGSFMQTTASRTGHQLSSHTFLAFFLMAGDSVPPPPDTTAIVSSDAARALAIRRCIIALAGTNSPLNDALLAELANVEVPTRSAPPATPLSHVCTSTAGSLDVPVASELDDISTRINSVLAAPADEGAGSSAELLTIDTLLRPSPSLSPSPSPSHSASPSGHASPLARTSLPTRTLVDHKVEDIDSPFRSPSCILNNAPTSIPLDSPLSTRARLTSSTTHVRSDIDMEWRVFIPDWDLRCVLRSSKDGGSVVYPTLACTRCIGAQLVCTGINNVKCARCKLKHLPCSLYDTSKGRIIAKMLVAGKNPFEACVAAPLQSGVTHPDSKCASCHNKREARVPSFIPTPSTSASSSIVATTAVSPTSSPTDSSLNVLLVFGSVLRAAADAFDKSLEEQGISEKVLGKRKVRD
ncbi:hypothetical protein EDC04DRAFT_782146 [Pisolithus marmoratus]|nr:hypothetical protein EDC04DRAFT_782146 [Pisolithus marmoratus]